MKMIKKILVIAIIIFAPLSILLLLGAAYGGNKVYFKKKQED